MKKKFLIFYTILASLLLLASAVYFIFSLCNEYSKGDERTYINFSTIERTLKQSSIQDLSSKEFSKALEDSIGDLNNFAYLRIEFNNIPIYTYPSENATVQETSLTKKYVSVIQKAQGDYNLTAVLYLLKPVSIAFYARNAFFAVLIITLITLIIIICTKASDQEKIAFDNERKINENNKTSNRIAKENIASDLEESENLEKSETKEKVSQSAKKSDETYFNLDSINSKKEESEKKVDNSSKKIEDESLKEAQEEKQENNEIKNEEKVTLPNEDEKPAELNLAKDEELYSPTTGILWEEYLLQRMDKEIERAIASEIDLAVFVFKIPLLPRDSQEIKNICNYLTLQFQFKDLLFEYKNDSLVALKISLSLDDALELAEKLYSDILNILQDTEAKCYIGISTRSIRIVSGERILQEATEATIHAQEDKDSPIIAFRVDAEKYRKYLEQV